MDNNVCIIEHFLLFPPPTAYVVRWKKKNCHCHREKKNENRDHCTYNIVLKKRGGPRKITRGVAYRTNAI